MDAREEKAAARSRWKKNQAYNYSKNKYRKKGTASGNDNRRDTGALAAVGPQPGTVALQKDEEQSGQSSSDEDNYDDEEGSGGDYEEWLTLYPAEPVAVLMRKRLALPDGDLLQCCLGQEDGSTQYHGKKEVLDTHINLNDLEKVLGSMPMVTALDIESDLQELMFGDAVHLPLPARVVDSDEPAQSKELGQQDRTESIAAIERPVLEKNDGIDKEMESMLRIDEKYSGSVDDILRQSVVDGSLQTAPAGGAHLEADDQELDDFLDSLT